MTRTLRAHAWLSALFVISRAALVLAGLRFSFSLDWMWLSDPGDLRERWLETLWYFHAFPPGMNALTGVLLKIGASNAAALAHAVFLVFGLVFVNALFYLARAAGLSMRAGFALALAFSLTPPSIYFEHLYLYEWPVATLLCVTAVLFHRAVSRPAFEAWFAFFAVAAVIGLTRSSFHLVWFVVLTGLGLWFASAESRRVVVTAALLPAALLVGLYAKNLWLFGEFAASTFGPASLTLVTVAQLPDEVRAEWVRDGRLSPFAMTSVYAPPRDYARYFPDPEHERWPPQLTRLEHQEVHAANFNHWWLLDVHRARRADALYSLRERPFDYLRNVASGLRDMLGPSTAWHPRDGTPASPHYQHRQVLGAYEAWFNRLFHTVPVAPIGLYAFLPVILVWAGVPAWRLARAEDQNHRARGALLLFCVFQMVYVIAASTMLTFLESARYRFQVEWAIWLLTAVCVASLQSRRSAQPSRTRVQNQTAVPRDANPGL
jgi:hypothetical protein